MEGLGLELSIEEIDEVQEVLDKYLNAVQNFTLQEDRMDQQLERLTVAEEDLCDLEHELEYRQIEVPNFAAINRQREAIDRAFGSLQNIIQNMAPILEESIRTLQEERRVVEVQDEIDELESEIECAQDEIQEIEFRIAKMRNRISELENG